MKAISGSIRLSASDLSNHLACHHLTSLDLAVSLWARPAPAWRSPDARCSRSAAWHMKTPILRIWKPGECPFSICGISMTPREHGANT